MGPCCALAELVKHYPNSRCESLSEGHEHHYAHLAQHHQDQPNPNPKHCTPRDTPRLGKGAAVYGTKYPYNAGIPLPALPMPSPEADLPLATTTQQRLLELGPSGEEDIEELRQISPPWPLATGFSGWEVMRAAASTGCNALANTAMATFAK
jgi:hypothetical protein